MSTKADSMGQAGGRGSVKLPNLAPRSSKQGAKRATVIEADEDRKDGRKIGKSVSTAGGSLSTMPELRGPGPRRGAPPGDASKRGLDSTGETLLLCLRSEPVQMASIRELLFETVRGKQQPRKGVGGSLAGQEPRYGWTPLFFPAASGDAALLRMLLDASADVSSACRHGNTALHLAARAGHEQCVQLLLIRGSYLDAKNRHSWTPLIVSAMGGHTKLATRLVEAAADAASADESGRNACMWAARSGFVDIVAVLARGTDLSSSDNDGLSIADHASEHRDMLAAILAIQRCNSQLLEAARQGDIEAAQQAIQARAQVNACDGKGLHPLDLAVSAGSLDVVRLLTRAGAEPDVALATETVAHSKSYMAMDAEVRRALVASQQLVQGARQRQWPRVLEALEAGAWVENRDAECLRTPMLWASMYGASAMCVKLSHYDARLDRADTFGWTPVHSAVHYAHFLTLSVLKCLGADFKVQTFEGDRVIHLAAKAGNAPMIFLLHTEGCTVNCLNAEGFSPLQLALMHGKLSALRALWVCRADMTVQDAQQRSLFSLAIVHDQEHVLKALLQDVSIPRMTWRGAWLKAMCIELPTRRTRKNKDDADSDDTRSPRSEQSAATAKSREHTQSSSKPTSGAATSCAEKRKTLRRKTGGREPDEEEARIMREFGTRSECKLLTDAIFALDMTKDLPAALSVETALQGVDEGGRTPLALAAIYRRSQILYTLLELQAMVNAVDKEGNTALMLAAEDGDKWACETLLAANADASTVNAEQLTALDLARNATVETLLRDHLDHLSIGAVLQRCGSEPSIRRKKRRDRPGSAPMLRLRLECLPVGQSLDVTQGQLRRILSRRRITPDSIDVPLDPFKQLSRGFAFVDFAERPKSDNLYSKDGAVLFGTSIRVYKEFERRTEPPTIEEPSLLPGPEAQEKEQHAQMQENCALVASVMERGSSGQFAVADAGDSLAEASGRHGQPERKFSDVSR